MSFYFCCYCQKHDFSIFGYTNQAPSNVNKHVSSCFIFDSIQFNVRLNETKDSWVVEEIIGPNVVLDLQDPEEEMLMKDIILHMVTLMINTASIIEWNWREMTSLRNNNET